MSRPFSVILWAIVALYAVTIVLRPAGLLPDGLNAPLGALLPAAFALLHGSRRYRWSGILVFAAICLVVSNAFENLSIFSGFPFGYYHYSDALGLKLFQVPVLIGLAYLGMGYLSWTIASLVLDGGRQAGASRLVAVPITASFVMVSWDLTLDPAASTIGHSWIWRDGGAYFGVPVSNFLGWYLTVFVFFQLFALYLVRRPPRPAQDQTGFWWPAWTMFAVSIVRPVLTALFHPAGPSAVTDAAGVTWNVAALYGTCALAAIFTMGAFAVLALLRFTESSRNAVESRRLRS
jgi:putative membrane protein